MVISYVSDSDEGVVTLAVNLDACLLDSARCVDSSVLLRNFDALIELLGHFFTADADELSGKFEALCGLECQVDFLL